MQPASTKAPCFLLIMLQLNQNQTWQRVASTLSAATSFLVVQHGGKTNEMQTHTVIEVVNTGLLEYTKKITEDWCSYQDPVNST